jgi:hypothetical protein
MIASDPLHLLSIVRSGFPATLYRKRSTAPLRPPDGGATLMSSSFGGSVPMLPIDCTRLISIQRMQKKQSTILHHHAAHI